MNECKCFGLCDCKKQQLDDIVKDNRSVLDQLESLKKALESADYKAKPTELRQGTGHDGPELTIEDISEKFKDAFTQHAWEMMQNKIHELDVWVTPVEPIAEWDGDKDRRRPRGPFTIGTPKLVSSTVFLSVQVRKGEPKSEALARIIEMVNEFATRRWLVGVLAPLSRIDILDGKEAYFCFVHIKSEFYNNARKLALSEGFAIEEGQITEPLPLRVETDHVRFQGERNQSRCPLCHLQITEKNRGEDFNDLCVRCSDNKVARKLLDAYDHEYGLI